MKLLYQNYKILVYIRPGFEVKNKLNADAEVLNAPLLQIFLLQKFADSLRKGKSIRYLVPEKVRKEIEEKGYYKK